MATRVVCDDCKKPLDDLPRLMIPQMMLVTPDGKNGQAQGLHFCLEDADAKCLRSWLKKNINRPMLVTGAQGGPAQ